MRSIFGAHCGWTDRRFPPSNHWARRALGSPHFAASQSTLSDNLSECPASHSRQTPTSCTLRASLEGASVSFILGIDTWLTAPHPTKSRSGTGTAPAALPSRCPLSGLPGLPAVGAAGWLQGCWGGGERRSHSGQCESSNEVAATPLPGGPQLVQVSRPAFPMWWRSDFLVGS